MAQHIDRAYIIKRLKDFKRGIIDFESLVDGIAVDLDIRHSKGKLAKLRDHLEILRSELEDGYIKDSELNGLAQEMFTIIKENKMKKLTIKERKLVKEYAKKLVEKKIIKEQTYVIKSMNAQNFSRMDGLVKIQDIDDFISSATGIMTSLSDEGFDSKEIFDYLYLKLVANV